MCIPRHPEQPDHRPSPSRRTAASCAPSATGSPAPNKDDPKQSSSKKRRILVSKSPATAPSESKTPSSKTHRPKANAWQRASCSAVQRVHPRSRPTGPNPTKMKAHIPGQLSHHESQSTPLLATNHISQRARRTARGYCAPQTIVLACVQSTKRSKRAASIILELKVGDFATLSSEAFDSSSTTFKRMLRV